MVVIVGKELGHGRIDEVPLILGDFKGKHVISPDEPRQELDRWFVQCD